ILVELAEVRLQLLAFHKALVFPKKYGNDPLMQIVARREHHAEGKIIEVRNIDLVIRLVGRPDARDEVRRYCEIEKHIDGIYISEVRCEVAYRRLPGRVPALHDCFFRGFGKPHEPQSKKK